MSVMLTGSVGACSVVFAMIAGAYSYAAKHQWSSGDLYEGQSALQGQWKRHRVEVGLSLI